MEGKTELQRNTNRILIQREAQKEKDFQEAEENYTNAALQTALYKEAMEKEEKEKTDRSAQYCKGLQQQLASRQQQRQCEYEDTLIEKNMLEEMSRTMAEEDQRELQKKRVETEKLRQEMVTSAQARADWKDKQKETMAVEERQIEQQRQTASDRSYSVIAERERKIQMKDELNQKIGAKMLSDEMAQLERENIIELLQEQEYLEENAQDDIAERDNAEKVKKELKEALLNQMDDKKQEVLKQKYMDAEFTKQANAIMAAGDQEDRERAIKIKEKERQYSQDLRQQIEDNAQRRAAHDKLEDAQAHSAWDWGRDWHSEVTDERRKIVSEHALEDLIALREGSSKSPQLGQLHIDDIAQTSGGQRRPKWDE